MDVYMELLLLKKIVICFIASETATIEVTVI